MPEFFRENALFLVSSLFLAVLIASASQLQGALEGGANKILSGSNTTQSSAAPTTAQNVTPTNTNVPATNRGTPTNTTLTSTATTPTVTHSVHRVHNREGENE